MVFNPRDWLDLARRLDRLWGAEARLSALIDAQDKEIRALKDRIARLEAREEVLIAEAKGATAAAASAIASQHLASLAREVGAIDERTRRLRGDPER